MSAIMPKLDKMAGLFEKYQQTYDIKFCDLNEIDDVVSFIDNYWKRGHILVKSRELMDWQHLDKLNKRYNFVLARHKASGEIHAILGLVPTSQFDTKLPFSFVWGAIWKTREDVAFPGLGVCLFYYIKQFTPIEVYAGFGLSDDAIKNHKSMGFCLGEAKHFFFVNPKITTFSIAQNIEPFQHPITQSLNNFVLREITIDDYNSINSCSLFSNKYKSKDYYANRYLKHPIYKYKFLGIYKDNSIQAILVLRNCFANNSCCIRIVEYIGDYNCLENVRGLLSNYLSDNNAEYLDIYVSNVDIELLKKAGFVDVTENENVIIPNYFEPFVQTNVTMNYAYSAIDENFQLVVNKGDSDQDRPSIL